MGIPESTPEEMPSEWFVVYIKTPDISTPHYHICIPINKEHCIIACIITSKIDNNIKYYQVKKATHSLVHINNSDLSCLTQNSIVNCNKAKIILSSDFAKNIKISKQEKTNSVKINYQLKKKISLAITTSKIVSDDIKDFVKNLKIK